MWLTLLLKYWYIAVIAVLIASNAFVSFEWKQTQASLVHEKAAHAQDVLDFKSAQTFANNQAEATRLSLKKESEADAAKADASYHDLLAKYNASLLRYSASRSGGQEASNHQLPAPSGSNGPSTGAQLPAEITITGPDAEICAVNTARLQAVHDWAVSLPKEVP